MNFFLFINRKLIFVSGIILFCLFILIIFFKQTNLSYEEVKNIKNRSSNADISEPKFSINNNSNQIFITAAEGNFLNKNEILLKDNVRFKSNDFSIETDKVIFNRDKQTAQSSSRSLFKSKNTSITSDGFDIYDKGDKIIFYGNSYIILK